MYKKTNFSGCETGHYGENCSSNCKHCQNKTTCGITNGECDDIGCASPVYQPPLCKGKYLPFDTVFQLFPRHIQLTSGVGKTLHN